MTTETYIKLDNERDSTAPSTDSGFNPSVIASCFVCLAFFVLGCGISWLLQSPEKPYTRHDTNFDKNDFLHKSALEAYMKLHNYGVFLTCENCETRCYIPLTKAVRAKEQTKTIRCPGCRCDVKWEPATYANGIVRAGTGQEYAVDENPELSEQERYDEKYRSSPGSTKPAKLLLEAQ